MEKPNIETTLARIERLLIINTKNVLTVSDLAMILDVTESRIRHLVCSHEIPYYKKGRRVFFKKSEVEAWQLEDRTPSEEEIDKKAMTYVALHKVNYR